MDKYILVSWPEIQSLMDHSRWDECLLCSELDDEDPSQISDQTYAVPEDLYYEVYPTAKDNVASAIDRLKTLSKRDSGDPEVDHLNADSILLGIIEELGYPEVTDIFAEIEKWYA